MKYVIAGIFVMGTFGAWLVLPSYAECCEYVGLLAPDGVSEVPGVEHAEIAKAREDGAIPKAVPGLRLGDYAGEILLPDMFGVTQRVDFSAHRLTAIVWVSSFCPTSKVYEDRLNKLRAAIGDEVAFWGINSSAMESTEELRTHFTRDDPLCLLWPILKDDGNAIADRFGASVSAEIFIFNREGKLEYRGGIDNARNPQRVSEQYAHPVLESLLAGKPPEWRYQAPKGCCPIDRLGAPTDSN